jgi:MutS domain V
MCCVPDPGIFYDDISDMDDRFAAVDPDPRREYKHRLEERGQEVARRERQHIWIGNARLGVAVLAALLAWLAFSREWLSGWWLLVPLFVFIALAVVHERVLRWRARSQRAVRFYQRGLGRLEDDWAGKGESGDRFNSDSHPYAQDLDLFGQGSLFELLSIARTRAGEETLARWLMEPAPLEEIRARQEAVDELRFHLDLREDLSLLGDEVRAGIDAAALPRWGAGRPLLDNRLARIAAVALALAALASFIGWVAFDLTNRLFLWVLAMTASVGLLYRGRVLQVAQAVEEPAHDLALMSEVLVRLEREHFQCPKLATLRKQLDAEGIPPSRRIRRLNRLMELLDSRDNLAVRLIGPPLLWTTQLAFAIEAWRKRTGPAVRGWIGAVGELGALLCLANYAYERPEDPFPEFVEGPARFEGEGLGHPLIPETRSVRNDLTLGPDLRVFMVSGSNMSGKTTLLRTVGTNVVLAMAGAPVRARRLRMSPLAVGASIHVHDSLQAGSSRFYTEITRLRRLLDVTRGPLPLVFLLDELLHGTNSHDRRIGAEAVVRSLVNKGALGLVTTHDLALVRIVDSLEPHGANVHFEDHFENGKITFDYKLRPGVVEKSNALDLMRSIGLEV